jgi:hypothetical protein
MKRTALACVAIVMSWSLAAMADSINILDTDDSTSLGTLSVTRTTLTNWDELDLYVTSLSGKAAGTTINLLVGSWSAEGDGSPVIGLYAGTGTTWVTKMRNSNNTVGQSIVNFSLTAGASQFTRVAGTGGYTVVSSGSGATAGSWYADKDITPSQDLSAFDADAGTESDDGIDETLLAKMYVTKGADVSFSGAFGFSNGTTPNASFTTVAVPEPGTLAMLAAGLFGLMAYAWRKRK